MKTNKFIILLVLGLSLSACKEDFLTTVPSASVDANSAVASTKSASASVNGIYRQFVTRYLGSQGHFGYPAMMLIMDHMGEDVLQGTASASWHVAETRWVSHRTDNATMPLFGYTLYYRIISNANTVIAGIDKAVGTQSDRDLIKGEALALRGFAYSNLVQLYGKRYDAAVKPNSQLGVPLVLEPNEVKSLPRSTVEEIYTQVNKDLADAAVLLKGKSRSFKSHINYDVVRGLQARVALTQQNWEAAAAFANEARKPYSYMNEAQLLSGFSDIASPEWMWGFDHIEDQSEFFGAYHSYISCNYNSTVIRTYPKVISRVLYDAIPTTDSRSKMWIKTPTAANSVVPTGGVRPAYLNQKFRLPGNPSTSAQGDIPYMRSSEMTLIEAEALARQGKNTEAAKVLFELVSKRDAAYKESTNTGTALLTEIAFQRRVELWGEGHRFLDLKRRNEPLNRNGSNHIAAITTVFDIPAGDKQWEFLIPRAEMDANKASVQNPL